MDSGTLGEVERRASAPGDRLLAIFDVFDEWFQRADFEGCSFINVLLEMPEPGHALHVATTDTWLESAVSLPYWRVKLESTIRTASPVSGTS
jgi:hypothetical protein